MAARPRSSGTATSICVPGISAPDREILNVKVDLTIVDGAVLVDRRQALSSRWKHDIRRLRNAHVTAAVAVNNLPLPLSSGHESARERAF
ncbi:hypothetical protein [Aurantiacibacter xanthus]|uniref:hypothetical protein n=1 Tax=Aurantiacibacter xanthus TaxID=1784712 RepID=UPI0011C2256C|nr:hypothetical protein [Aurantiacibacter xanthus]